MGTYLRERSASRSRRWMVRDDKHGNRLDLIGPGRFLATKRHLDGKAETMEISAEDTPAAVAAWEAWISE